MTIDDNPFEVGMGRLADLDKERGFIGQEALRRVAVEGVIRKIAGIVIDGEPLETHNENHWPVRCDDESAGELTASVQSPCLGHTEPGTQFGVEPPVGAHGAVATELPFVDRDGQVLRQELR